MPTSAASTRKPVLLGVLALVSLVFLVMVQDFLVTLLFAAILSGMCQPLYRVLLRRLGGRPGLASMGTLSIFALLVLVPMLALTSVVAAEAISLTQVVSPVVQDWVAHPDAVTARLRDLPFYESIAPYRDDLIAKVGQVVEGVGGLVLKGVSGATKSTLTFLFKLFILLYAMFFFIKDGHRVLSRILYYLPLPDEDEERLISRFVSVSRATLKGTLIIGLLQGSLAGVALGIAGLPTWVFWSAVMAVLSIIPGVGGGLVWVPAVIYLMATGKVAGGVVAAVFCAAVVGSVDNFLRPRLVGGDAQMHELLILLGTLGGLVAFGVPGVMIGPIVAALFVTIWEIYGEVFADFLPRVDRKDPAEALVAESEERVEAAPAPRDPPDDLSAPQPPDEDEPESK